MDRPQFSIVIPTLNEEKYLPVLLQDLADQTLKNFEIIHVDGGSEDKTIDKSKRFTDKLNLTILHSDKKNVGHQRNQGGDAAIGEWIIFMDADNRLASDFIERLHEELQKEKNFGVFTCLTTSLKKPRTDMGTYRMINIGQLLSYSIGHYTAYGAMIGVKKTIFNTIKFDVNKKLFEDTLFVRTVINHGYKFKIFREPRFEYSLRRFKKEGPIKTTRNTIMALVNFVQGGKFNPEDDFYPMTMGGKYYEEPQKK